MIDSTKQIPLSLINELIEKLNRLNRYMRIDAQPVSDCRVMYRSNIILIQKLKDL